MKKNKEKNVKSKQPLRAEIVTFSTLLDPPPIYFNSDDVNNPWNEINVEEFKRLTSRINSPEAEGDPKIKEAYLAEYNKFHHFWLRKFFPNAKVNDDTSSCNLINWLEHTYHYHRLANNRELGLITEYEEAVEDCASNVTELKKLEETAKSSNKVTKSLESSISKLKKLISKNEEIINDFEENFNKKYTPTKCKDANGNDIKTYSIEENVPLDENYAYLSESTIKNAIAKLYEYDLLEHWSYAFHDKDTINLTKEAEPPYINFTEKFKNEKGEDVVLKAGHWHINLLFKVNIPVESIASLFKFEGREEYFKVVKGFPQKLGGRLRAYYDLLKYLPHRGNAQLQGKYRYPDSIIKSDMTFDEIADIFQHYMSPDRVDELADRLRLLVRRDGWSILKLKKEYATTKAYLENCKELQSLRGDYLSDTNICKLPEKRINLYITGVGGSGKDVTSRCIARLLTMDLDYILNSDVSIDDIPMDGSVCVTSSQKTAFERYDGEPVVIFSDKKSYELVGMFDNEGDFNVHFDNKPQLAPVQKKFSHAVLHSSVHIVNSTQPFECFIHGLAGGELSPGGYSIVNYSPHKAHYQTSRRFCMWIDISETETKAYVNKAWCNRDFKDPTEFELLSEKTWGTCASIIYSNRSVKEKNFAVYTLLKPIVEKLRSFLNNAVDIGTRYNDFDYIGLSPYDVLERKLDDHKEFTENDKDILYAHRREIMVKLNDNSNKLLKSKRDLSSVENSIKNLTSVLNTVDDEISRSITMKSIDDLKEKRFKYINDVKVLTDEKVKLDFSFKRIKSFLCNDLSYSFENLSNMIVPDFDDIAKFSDTHFKLVCKLKQAILEGRSKNYFPNFMTNIELACGTSQPLFKNSRLYKTDVLPVADLYYYFKHFAPVFLGTNEDTAKEKLLYSSIKNLKKFVSEFEKLDLKGDIKKSEFYETYYQYFQKTQALLNDIKFS
jgi:hypothetical protein